MTKLTRRRMIGAAAAFAGIPTLLPGVFAQQAYPGRPVRIVVSSAPGGIDTIVRLITPALQDRTGQSFVVENKPGANGITGVQAVASAAPDGYTILFTTISTLTINPYVYQNLPYHPLKDLEPIALHAMLPMVWASHPAKGFKSLKNMVDYARANPASSTSPIQAMAPSATCCRRRCARSITSTSCWFRSRQRLRQCSRRLLGVSTSVSTTSAT